MSRSLAGLEPSARRIEANRRNARLSTGPRTAQGKARCSRNALKHGLRSQALLLPGEDQDQFRELRDQMLLSINPRNALELSLAEQVISDCWRIRRAWSAERNVYEQSPTLLRQLRKHSRRTIAAGNARRGRRGSVQGIQTNAERLVRLQWSRPHWEQEQLRENPQRLQPHVRRMWEHAQTAAADDPEGIAEEADPVPARAMWR